MRLKRSHSSDSPGTPAPDAPTRGRLAVVLLSLVALACGALLLGYAEPLRSLMGPVPLTDQIRLLLAVDTILLVAALSVMVRSSSAGRTRRKSPGPGSAATDQDVVEVDPALDSESAAAPTVLVDVRVLQAQIRALEEALYQQTLAEARLADSEYGAATVSEPEATSDPASARVREAATIDEESVREEVTREVLHRVRCTVRGLGLRMEGDPVAADILARVDAAVDRLAATGLFVRPTLSGADHTLPIPTDVPDLPPAPTVEAPTVEAPTVEATPAVPAPPVPGPPVAAPAPDAPEAEAPAVPAPDEPEVVLPVPAPPPAPAAPRGRRWLRRSTAA